LVICKQKKFQVHSKSKCSLAYTISDVHRQIARLAIKNFEICLYNVILNLSLKKSQPLHVSFWTFPARLLLSIHSSGLQFFYRLNMLFVYKSPCIIVKSKELRWKKQICRL
jgi:hypothetical protein